MGEWENSCIALKRKIKLPNFHQGKWNLAWRSTKRLWLEWVLRIQINRQINVRWILIPMFSMLEPKFCRMYKAFGKMGKKKMKTIIVMTTIPLCQLFPGVFKWKKTLNHWLKVKKRVSGTKQLYTSVFFSILWSDLHTFIDMELIMLYKHQNF